jgi:Holliday junction DNA helicase RuvA
MITLLDGILETKDPTRAVVVCGGVGYEVHIPLSSFDRLPAAGAPCRVLTHHHVWADGQALYGFATEGERRMFRLLLDVSGIGPKTALSALSGLSSRDLTAAVVGGDVKRLSSISGIGRKTAERIVLELRDKITDGEAMEAIAGAAGPGPDDHKRRDAVLALVSLGYKQAEAQKMIAAISAEDAAAASVEDLVRRALTGR